MKKLLFLPIMLLMVGTVFAYSASPNKIGLTQKDPNDWSVVDGAKGEVQLKYRYNVFRRGLEGVGRYLKVFRYYPQTARVSAKLKKAEPKTEYTLIYYGTEGHNDEWNYATCISSKKTNSRGNALFLSQKFNWLPFIDDGLDQKFWIVKSSDVDCANNQMTAWNPNEYLFETRTI